MTTTAQPDNISVAPLWTTKNLAKFLGCSERQIARLRDEGLPAVHVGGLVRFILSRVMDWLATQPELSQVPRERTGGGAHLAFICRDIPEVSWNQLCHWFGFSTPEAKKRGQFHFNSPSSSFMPFWISASSLVRLAKISLGEKPSDFIS